MTGRPLALLQRCLQTVYLYRASPRLLQGLYNLFSFFQDLCGIFSQLLRYQRGQKRNAARHCSHKRPHDGVAVVGVWHPFTVLFVMGKLWLPYIKSSPPFKNCHSICRARISCCSISPAWYLPLGKAHAEAAVQQMAHHGERECVRVDARHSSIGGEHVTRNIQSLAVQPLWRRRNWRSAGGGWPSWSAVRGHRRWLTANRWRLSRAPFFLLAQRSLVVVPVSSMESCPAVGTRGPVHQVCGAQVCRSLIAAMHSMLHPTTSADRHSDPLWVRTWFGCVNRAPG